MTIEITEDQRQLIVMALAKLSAERPGWDACLVEIALKIDNKKPDGRPQQFDDYIILWTDAATRILIGPSA